VLPRGVWFEMMRGVSRGCGTLGGGRRRKEQCLPTADEEEAPWEEGGSRDTVDSG